MKKIYLLLTLVAAFFLGSCSSKMKSLSPDYFTVTPGVLEVVGSEVPVVIDGKFPAEFFNKKSVLTITPVLKYEGGEALAEPMTFQGEKVRGNDRVVSYDNGATFRMKMAFDYVPGMENAELYLRSVVNKGSKQYALPDVKIADGCVATSQLYRQTAATANIAKGEDAFQRVIKQAKEANIMFLIQQTNLRSSELNSADMQAIRASIADLAADFENKVLDEIKISAYASPDGKQSINERLAKARQASSSDYINDKLEELDLVSPLATRYTAEDWEGFQELVGASNIQDKEIILRVLSMYEDPEERERQIKNISAAYTELIDEVLPELRRARITLNYVLIGRTDEEILKQLNADPTKLSVEELLYVATFDECVGKQKEIYAKTVELYPNDYRAYNNLGLVAQLNGNMAEAKQWFAKAASINGSAPEVNANLALVALAEGNIENAEAYLGRATEADNYNELLAALQVCKGNYTAAAANAKNGKSTTAALALIMNKDYATALTILNVMPNKTATNDYLKAVCYARQNRTDAAITALASAFQKDASLKERAAKDLEFAKLANKSAFQSLF